jgi:hypothetical protein
MDDETTTQTKTEEETKHRPSMRKAINAMCRDCVYDPMSGDGNWRQRVERCTSPECPLYELRPMPEMGPPRGQRDE